MNLRPLFAVILASSCLLAGAAQARTYTCQFELKGDGKILLNRQITISASGAALDARVTSRRLGGARSRTTRARVTENSSKRLTVVWRERGVRPVSAVGNVQRSMDIDLRMTVLKSKRRATQVGTLVSTGARSTGRDQQSARGKCR